MELPRLKTLRLLAGWSQRDLAAHAGVTQRTIGKLERGVARARPSTTRKLAAALGVSIPALVGQGSTLDALVSGTPGSPDAVRTTVSLNDGEGGN